MSDLVERIQKARKQRNAIILAHNYQIPEVQDIADFAGDSLDLSNKARQTDAEVIVFCGVRFMAETAAILSPHKTVLLPDENAGCPLAEMITPADIRKLKKEHPGAPVVCYINTTAAVKAECDICCTSANALKVVESLSAPEIIFVPDKYLGGYIRSKTKKKIILWHGFCPTHQTFNPTEIEKLKKEHQAAFMIHPESNPEAVALADYVGGTGGMVQYACENPGPFIVGTENGIIHRLQKENPDKIFIKASAQAICPNMKKITLEKILWALEDMRYVVAIEEPIRTQAQKAIERMLAIS